ncbi:MAG: hypothetical protein ACLFPN_03005 [Methanomassiliicoccales archaeon]
MWKVLGREINLIEAGKTWKEEVIELSRRKKGRPRFLDMLDDAEITYFFDTIEEVHSFEIGLPTKYGPEDVKFFRDFIKKVLGYSEHPVIEYQGKPQRYTVVVTAEREKDVYRGMGPR